MSDNIQREQQRLDFSIHGQRSPHTCISCLHAIAEGRKNVVPLRRGREYGCVFSTSNEFLLQHQYVTYARCYDCAMGDGQCLAPPPEALSELERLDTLIDTHTQEQNKPSAEQDPYVLDDSRKDARVLANQLDGTIRTLFRQADLYAHNGETMAGEDPSSGIKLGYGGAQPRFEIPPGLLAENARRARHNNHFRKIWQDTFDEDDAKDNARLRYYNEYQPQLGSDFFTGGWNCYRNRADNGMNGGIGRLSHEEIDEIDRAEGNYPHAP